MTTVALLSPGTISFDFLAQRSGGKEGGRKLFEQLVEDVVALTHPDVSTIAANPGDWGIDAYVGELLGGEVSIWQAKYYIDEFGTTQQADVRESYKSARKAATEHGYTIATWTLSIPCQLDGPSTKWWLGWKARTSKADNVVIELLDEGKLRRRLQGLDEETTAVRNHYFNPVAVLPSTSEADGPAQRALLRLIDGSEYDDALFVKQMTAANLIETLPAREAFFNAEILGQEITDKGVPAEVVALTNWRVRVAATWGVRFNAATQQAEDDRLPGLFIGVMEAIEQHHTSEASSVRASPVHGHGLMHQEVEGSRAGWVRHWPEIASAHSLPTSSAASPNQTDVADAIEASSANDDAITSVAVLPKEASS